MPTKYYFDNAATTPVREEVLQEILPYFREYYGNASSIYSIAKESKKALEAARAKVAAAIGATPDEIYFTAGGSESDNMALRGVVNASKKEKKHIITTKIEHHAILHTAEFLETKGVDVTYLNVDEFGKISLEELENLRIAQTKIQAETESLRAEKAELQTELNKLQEEKSGLEAVVETLNTEKAGQQAEMEALQKAKDELQARTEVLEAEKEKALSELKSLRTEKVKLETEAEKLRAEQQELKAEADDLSVQLETQQLALAKEKEHTAARLAEWKSREDSLKTELKRKKAEAQTIFQKQQQEIRQLKQQLAALKSDHARSAGQSSLDGLKNGLGQMLFKVTGNAGRNSAGKRSEAMRQWDADSYSEERTQWRYAENPSRAEKTQGQADDYGEKSQEIVKTDYASQKNDTAVTEQGAPAAGQNMTVTAAVHPASDTISDVALDTTSDTVPAPTAPDENNLTDTVNKTADDAIAETAKACEDMQVAQEAKTQDSENADAQQKQQEKDTYYKEHVNTVNETIARAQERIAKMLQELQTEVE